LLAVRRQVVERERRELLSVALVFDDLVPLIARDETQIEFRFFADL
jgi:hypothetical protein